MESSRVLRARTESKCLGVEMLELFALDVRRDFALPMPSRRREGQLQELWPFGSILSRLRAWMGVKGMRCLHSWELWSTSLGQGSGSFWGGGRKWTSGLDTTARRDVNTRHTDKVT